MVLVCHVISQDHVTKGWSNIMCRRPSWQVTSFPTCANCTSGDIMILGCHVISQDHVIKGLCDFIAGAYQR